MNAKLKTILCVAALCLLACDSIKPTASLGVTPKEISFNADGGSKRLAFEAPAAWTATTSAAWITINPASGDTSGSVVVEVTAAKNETLDPRTATIVISVPEKNLTETVVAGQEAGSGTPGPGPDDPPGPGPDDPPGPGPDDPPDPDDPQDPDPMDNFIGSIEDWLDESIQFERGSAYPHEVPDAEEWYIFGNMYETEFVRVYPMEKIGEDAFYYRFTPPSYTLGIAFMDADYPNEQYSNLAGAVSSNPDGSGVPMTGHLELPVAYNESAVGFLRIEASREMELYFYPKQSKVVLDYVN